MISKLLDWFSNFLAPRKGLLPLIGIVLIIFNYILQFFFPLDYWLTGSNLFLHLGVVIAIFGTMLARAL
jgi:membrane-bound ClpP family serine protease